MKPAFKNLIDLVRTRSQTSANESLYTFLLDGDDDEDKLSYAGLEESSRRLGAFFQQENAKGERALLLYPPGLDYIRAFFGCLYSGVIAVPAYPPDPNRLNRTLPRLLSIIRDSQAKYVLTTRVIKDMAEFLFVEAPELRELTWISTDDLSPELASQWKDLGASEKDLAFLQYTSGSTGEAKGVMVSHGNLLHNLELIKVACQFGPHSQGVSWLPPYHDMGLIAGILEPLYANYPMTLFSPLDFLQKPLRWLKALSKYKGTMTGGPNFAYELCVRKASPEFIQSIDLSHWDLASSGAEPVQAGTIHRFYETFKACGFKFESFFPSYGLAENTLIVCGHKNFKASDIKHLDKKAFEQHKVVEVSPSDSTLSIVSCGPNIADQKIIIVNPENFAELPSDEVGEIWISGPSVAQGYWNKPDKNEEIFAAFTNLKKGPFLRTGDLGFIENGNLFIAGRLKDLIIVRGAKHYPHDIEFSIEKADLPLRLGCGAAFSVPLDSEEGLVVSWEVDQPKMEGTSYEEVFQKIREVLAQNHEIKTHAIVLLKKGHLPKTSSGKIQRSAAKEAFLKNTFKTLAEWKEQVQKISNTQTVLAQTSQFENSENFSRIEIWLMEKLSEKIHVPVTEIDPSKPFSFYGLDSKEAVGVSGELEAWLGKSLPPTLLWQYPNIHSLAQFLSGQGIHPTSSKKSTNTFLEPIAVVGMSCRFPGAPNVDAYWELLKNGVDAISEVPKSRWNVDAFYDSQGIFPGKMNTRWGGFLDKMDEFDARFFGISPREAMRMDPQQRLLLEQTWEAFENAGIPPESMAGSQTGVFIGIGSSDYMQIQYLNFHNIDAYIGTGNAHSIAANRISYLFDFKGPSLALDTACSSSLVALHLACKSLRSGESDFALAGGVNLILKPETTIVFSQARMMSSKGRCHTFDEDADGYVRSEGCSVVLLKRYSDALKDGDKVLALIRGSAVNQDGHSNGLTAPSSHAQLAVMRDAIREAGIQPSEISYFEAHGTGTPLGDPIETESIASCLQEGRDPQDKCWLASVKTNIGHLEVASGLAGLIKVILSFRHQQIPQHLHFKKINPHIPLDKMPLRIPLRLEAWETSGKTRFAAVNSFGFGGTNANIILQEAPQQMVAERSVSHSAQIFKFSAKSEKALKEVAKNYAEFLAQNEEVSLEDFAQSLNLGRSDFEHRAFALCDSKDKAIEALKQWSESQNSSIQSAALSHLRKPKLAFLFTGQGSQYPGMAKQLYESEVIVKEIFDRCNEILKPYLEKPLLSVLFSSSTDADFIHETAYTQPALFVLEYALSELWRAWGIEADYVMGHSVGEYVAACYAGVMTWEEGLRLIAERARLMQSLPKDGLMAVIASTEAAVAAAIGPFAAEISIAGVNNSKNVVISGKKARVEAFVKYFSGQGIATQILTVSHAFHSPLMDPILDEFESKAQQVQFKAPRIKLVSNLKGKIFDNSEIPDARYYRDHLRSAVRFSEGIEALSKEGCELFLELGPQAHLSGMGRKCLQSAKVSWLWSLKKDTEDKKSLLEAAGKLYLGGISPDWMKLNQVTSFNYVTLPTYPFEREKFWLDMKGRSSDLTAIIHPLLGEKIDSPLPIHQFTQQVDFENFPYLKDHAVSGEVIYPAAAYVEMALAAAQNVWPSSTVKIKAMKFNEALFLERGQTQELSLVLSPETKSEASLQILSRLLSVEKSNTWRGHVTSFVEAIPVKLISPSISLSELQNQCTRTLDRADFYEALRKRGLEYGPAFQALKQIWVGEKQALALIRLPEEVTGSSKHYLLHPSVLDAGFQLVAALLSEQKEISESIYLPSGISELIFSKACPTEVWAHVTVPDSFNPSSTKLKLNLEIMDADGDRFVQLQGLELTALESTQSQKEKKDESCFYEQAWVTLASVDSSMDVKGSWIFIHPHASENAAIIHQKIISEMKVQGAEVLELNSVSPTDLKTLHEKVKEGGKKWRGVIYSGLQELSSENEICSTLLNWLQVALQEDKPLPLYILTQNTQSIENTSLQLRSSSLWGMARSLRLEHPELRCKMIDLDSQVNEATLLKELSIEDSELEVSLRGSDRYVSRLERVKESSEEDSQKLSLPSSKDYRLEIAKSGTLEGLELRPLQTQSPLPEEVQIEVFASALNFSDVLKALGLYPGLGDGPVPIGIECSGKVLAVGNSVKNFKVGDEVLAVAPFAFGSRVSTRSEFVALKPSSMSFEEAAGLPIAYLTAHYALNHLGRMRRGEKILIHAGAGGVGVAAIHLAKMAGLEVFATAGSPEKREFLKGLGVDHVLDSRSLAFAEEILKITQGKGVDLVLNSLSGDFIPKSISVLGAYGRFLEIGKIDIYQNSKIGLLPFQNNLSYFAIDLDRVLREKPDWIRIFLDELMGYFKQASLKSLPHTDFPIEDSIQAFRYMAQRKNIGKVVIRLKTSHASDAKTAQLLSSDEVYLISGGLGDLGLQILSSLHHQGAKNFALFGRSNPSQKAESLIQALRSEGCDIRIYAVDVSKKDELEKVLQKIRTEGKKIGGIVHAAGILEDAVFLKQNTASFEKVFAPKVQGSWNFHDLTQKDSLKFFILFSSLASVVGSPGQSNYAAANAFMDSLAQLRQQRGLPALSINWGPWAEVGMAARAEEKASQSAKGLKPLALSKAMQSFEKALKIKDKSQLGIWEVDWQEWSKILPNFLTQTLLSNLVDHSTSQGKKIEVQSRAQILSLKGEARKEALLQVIRARIAKVLAIAPDALATEQPLNTLGLDSLMAIEMKNDIENSLGASLTMAFLLKGPSISQMADHLALQMEHMTLA